jgi:dinuclear metal center YbgI/SA1388 family protein
MKVKDITTCLEQWAPTSLQEDYDNCGLIIGDETQPVTNVLITLDITEAVINEAIREKCELIVAHHPLIFKGIKRLNGKNWVDRCIVKAIKADICIYAIHTNLDNIATGVNQMIASKLSLQQARILQPKEGNLLKLEIFVPTTSATEVLAALHQAGAGQIGLYDQCSFQTNGIGSFRPLANANPTIGTVGVKENVKETKLEVILPSHAKSIVLKALIDSHPYEEVAYYLTKITNQNQEVGSGYFGQLEKSMSPDEFIKFLKERMDLKVVKHTSFMSSEIKKVALCGGSGSFLLKNAIQAGADVFISSDFKYHDYFEADGKITILDIGHYESEVFTKDLLNDFLKQKFANIAFNSSEVVTNPIIYS